MSSNPADVCLKTYIALLRGINVGSSRRVTMDALEKTWAEIGAKNVKTYLQSGNVLFEHPATDFAKLMSNIEATFGRSVGFDVSVILRTKEDLHRVVRSSPFKGRDEKSIYVTFLKSKPSTPPPADMVREAAKSEEFLLADREVYLFCPNGYGRTKLSNAFFERKLNVRATTRNWNTVTTLLSMVP